MKIQKNSAFDYKMVWTSFGRGKIVTIPKILNKDNNEDDNEENEEQQLCGYLQKLN